MIIRPLPKGSRRLLRRAEYTEATLPDAVKRPHAAGDSAWALIHVMEGRLRCSVDDPHRLSRSAILTAQGDQGVIAPGVLHHFELLGPVRLVVEEYQFDDQVTPARAAEQD